MEDNYKVWDLNLLHVLSKICSLFSQANVKTGETFLRYMIHLFVQIKVIQIFGKGMFFPCSETWGKCPSWNQTKIKHHCVKKWRFKSKECLFLIATSIAGKEHAIKLLCGFDPTKWRILEKA